MVNQKRKIAIYLVILFSLLASGLFPIPVYAQEPENQGGFTEDFENNTLERWELSPEAIVTEGHLRL